MLDAKKIAHSIYSFSRKGELFYYINKVSNINKFDGDLVEKKLKRMILTKNLLNLSQYFESLDKNHLNYISSNKNEFINLFNQNSWSKGIKIFNHYIK